MVRLTDREIERRVYENSLNTCHYVGGYTDRNGNIAVRCEKHNLEFTTRYENVGRATRKHHICPLCQEEDRNKSKAKVVCNYCGKEFFKTKSNVGDFNFCCRECKDLAQRISSGAYFDSMRPSHYKEGAYVDYRRLALAEYKNKCAVCG